MEIVLTQRDADWIAALVRTKMKQLDDNYNDIVKSSQDRVDICQKIADVFELSDDAEIKEKQRDLSDSRNEMLQRIKTEYFKARKDYERVIELMIVGSSA